MDEGVKAHRGAIVITITDELAAFDLAMAFGRADGFYDEVMAAASKAWPADRGEPTDA